MSLSGRNLLQDKTRLLLSVGGVALAVLLILVLDGFLTGMYRQITAYLDHSPASIIVAQEDVVNSLGATSLLPSGVSSEAEAIRGVEQAIPVLSQFVILDLHGKKQPAYMVGYDPDEGGGPWKLSAGREPKDKREIVFDRVLAARHHLKIGDKVEVLDKDFTISGLSVGTASWMTSYFFLKKTAAEDLLLVPEATSLLMITTSKGADLGYIVQRLNKISGINALNKSEMAANDLKFFARIFSMPIKMMVSIAFLVGTMVVGLVIYTATIERQREYGVLKAIGAANRVLYQVVLVQALAASVTGAALGTVLAYGVGELIMATRPQFLIIYSLADIGWALFAGLSMALLAAIFPVRVVAGLAPAEVFRK